MAEKSFFNIISNSAEKAVIEIDGYIGDYVWDKENGWHELNTGKDIRSKLKDLGDVKEIDVLITSMGGNVDYAFQIHDALKDHQAKVTTIINGFCASAATIIALAGDVRKISKNSVYLIHKCSSAAWGNEHDLETELESQKTVNDVMYNMYKAVCKKDEQELLDLFNADNGHGKWITAQEVVDFGFCDEIYNGGTASAKVALVDSALLDKLGYPQIPSQSEIQEDRIMNRIIEKMRGIFAPKENPIINQKQEPMKKFAQVFAFLAACLVALKDSDYDPEKGVTLTDEQLNGLEGKLAEMNSAKEALERDKADLNSTIATLTAERDDYKAKWENAPHYVNPVEGTDPDEDITANAGYERLEKMI